MDCARAHNLAVANTFFRERLIQTITYASNGRAMQIDYWLTQRPHLKLVVDVKVVPLGNIIPLHWLLIMDMHLDVGQQ